MSDAPARARASSAKRPKAGASKRVSRDKTDAVLLAEFEATMERSGKRLEKLNADLDAMLSRLGGTRLPT